MRVRTGVLALLVALALMAGAVWVWYPSLFVDPSEIFTREEIEAMIVRAGIWGPVTVIVLMTAAVVASPIPSAPIALAAGAAYGHYAGTAFVAIGAELGAMIAFLLARTLGRGPVKRMLGDKADYGLLGSQNALTFTVFFSRLLPFVSFDAMSYAAGLSCLHFWRFALATMAGILPASFVLAHFGSAAMEGDFGSAEWVALGLGFATAIPLVVLALRRGPRKETDVRDSD